jgi:hypothetical protein
MDDQTYRQILEEFLNGYWGAFHEALEAQSVTPTRLAGSLFDDLCAAHARFAALDRGRHKHVLDALDRVWSGLRARRAIQPDPPFHADEVERAHDEFKRLYDALTAEGKVHGDVTEQVLCNARHLTPLHPLRVDSAR